VTVLRWCTQNSNQLHSVVTYYVLRYLKRAPNKGLSYRPSPYLGIVGNTHYNWPRDPLDRRSINIYYTFRGCNLVT